MSGVFRQPWTPQLPKPLTPVFTATPLGTPIARNNAAAAYRDSYEYRQAWTQGDLAPVFTDTSQFQISLLPIPRIRESQDARTNWTQPELAPNFTQTPLGIPIARNNCALNVRDAFDFRTSWTQPEMPVDFTAGIAPPPLKSSMAQPSITDTWRGQVISLDFPFFSDELVVVPPPPLTAAFQRDLGPIQLPAPKSLPQSVVTAYVPPPIAPDTAYLREVTGIQLPQAKALAQSVTVSYVPPAEVTRTFDQAAWSRLQYSVEGATFQPVALQGYLSPPSLARYFSESRSPQQDLAQGFTPPQSVDSILPCSFVSTARLSHYPVQLTAYGTAVFAPPPTARPPRVRRFTMSVFNRIIKFNS